MRLDNWMEKASGNDRDPSPASLSFPRCWLHSKFAQVREVHTFRETVLLMKMIRIDDVGDGQWGWRGLTSWYHNPLFVFHFPLSHTLLLCCVMRSVWVGRMRRSWISWRARACGTRTCGCTRATSTSSRATWCTSSARWPPLSRSRGTRVCANTTAGCPPPRLPSRPLCPPTLRKRQTQRPSRGLPRQDQSRDRW